MIKWENQQDVFINLFLPRFDIDSDTDMLPILERLGVTDALNMFVADFSPLADNLELPHVSKAEQAARVIVDEEGCEAVAYTVIMGSSGSSGPPANMDTIVFDVNRPFIFAITGPDGLPLFVGIVNDPNG
jgi:serine protease inhibitor